MFDNRFILYVHDCVSLTVFWLGDSVLFDAQFHPLTYNIAFFINQMHSCWKKYTFLKNSNTSKKNNKIKSYWPQTSEWYRGVIRFSSAILDLFFSWSLSKCSHCSSLGVGTVKYLNFSIAEQTLDGHSKTRWFGENKLTGRGWE